MCEGQCLQEGTVRPPPPPSPSGSRRAQVPSYLRLSVTDANGTLSITTDEELERQWNNY